MEEKDSTRGMSQSVKASSSSTSGGGSWRRRRGARERGFPKFCRCGEEAVIKPPEQLRTLEGFSIVVHMDLKRTNLIFFPGPMNVWWRRFTI
uniref:Uncharacterized protein n=1 Tax=Brassica oleracea var. oleracea TaxID=109376 RepID=A0A0D3D517_BRAOL